MADAACWRRLRNPRHRFHHGGSGSDPKLNMLALYAVTGGADFVIQAWLVSRRNHRIAAAGTSLSTS